MELQLDMVEQVVVDIIILVNLLMVEVDVELVAMVGLVHQEIGLNPLRILKVVMVDRILYTPDQVFLFILPPVAEEVATIFQALQVKVD